MQKRTQEKAIQLLIFVFTIVMIVLRFLLNEKGRVNPDSIRFFRGSAVFPVIDNTTTPLGYPLSLKFFTFFGFDEFWASKLVGVLSYIFLVYFAWKKKFYFRETLLVGGLFSYVSIFSFSLSEPLFLPFVFIFLYISREIIIGNLEKTKAIVYLSLILILLYNVRYSALFFMGACFVFGMIKFRKKYAYIFLISAIIGIGFIVLYKFLFIDYYNEKYVDQFLEIGLKPTSQLLIEFFQGLATSFNPFIHIANPSGGLINWGIYGIGVVNILLILFIFIKNKLSETEFFLVLVGVVGILCSYFIQYFYSINPLDYRLFSPFMFSIWLVYFKKLFQIFGRQTYLITVFSLFTGFVFTWLSKGNYLENRKQMNQFLTSENLKNKPIQFYNPNMDDLEKVQLAELLSTVNPNITITNQPKDTIRHEVLTEYKVLQKIKIDKNKFQ